MFLLCWSTSPWLISSNVLKNTSLVAVKVKRCLPRFSYLVSLKGLHVRPSTLTNFKDFSSISWLSEMGALTKKKETTMRCGLMWEPFWNKKEKTYVVCQGTFWKGIKELKKIIEKQRFFTEGQNTKIWNKKKGEYPLFSAFSGIFCCKMASFLQLLFIAESSLKRTINRLAVSRNLKKARQMFVCERQKQKGRNICRKKNFTSTKLELWRTYPCSAKQFWRFIRHENTSESILQLGSKG